MLENNEFNYSCEHTEDESYFPLSLQVVSRRIMIHSVKPPLDHTRYNLICDVFGLEPGLSPPKSQFQWEVENLKKIHFS